MQSTPGWAFDRFPLFCALSRVFSSFPRRSEYASAVEYNSALLYSALLSCIHGTGVFVVRSIHGTGERKAEL